MQVAVIGPATADDATRDAARDIGAGLAVAGAVVVTGGRGGVMAAATGGAEAAGGTTLALLPGDDAGELGAPATVVVPTGLGEARNALVVRAADAVIAVGGAWGTLSELALAIRGGTPVVGLGTWRFDLDLDRLDVTDPVHRVGTPEDAVRAAVELAQAP